MIRDEFQGNFQKTGQSLHPVYIQSFRVTKNHGQKKAIKNLRYVLPQKKQSPKSGCLKIAVTETLANN